MIDQQTTKIAAVTGATGAIGKAVATQLAHKKYQVVLITRNEYKSELAVKEIIAKTNNHAISYRIADLSRKPSIQSLADSWDGPLHLMVNNAAISPRERQVNPEGIELQFATNVLGYMWMMTSFNGILAESAPTRVINIASYWAGGLDLDDLEFIRRPYHNHDAYRQSKQANRMLTPIFADLFVENNITVNSCHPGDVNSALSNDLGFGGSQSPSEGASTPVWLATSESVEGLTGKYFEHKKEVRCQFASKTHEAGELYEICMSY
jgi:NAD(P)-dependent dehydrogenase (short-subunit alcohol dehydrogenase family)